MAARTLTRPLRLPQQLQWREATAATAALDQLLATNQQAMSQRSQQLEMLSRQLAKLVHLNSLRRAKKLMSNIALMLVTRLIHHQMKVASSYSLFHVKHVFLIAEVSKVEAVIGTLEAGVELAVAEAEAIVEDHQNKEAASNEEGDANHSGIQNEGHASSEDSTTEHTVVDATAATTEPSEPTIATPPLEAEDSTTEIKDSTAVTEDSTAVNEDLTAEIEVLVEEVVNEDSTVVIDDAPATNEVSPEDSTEVKEDLTALAEEESPAVHSQEDATNEKSPEDSAEESSPTEHAESHVESSESSAPSSSSSSSSSSEDPASVEVNKPLAQESSPVHVEDTEAEESTAIVAIAADVDDDATPDPAVVPAARKGWLSTSDNRSWKKKYFVLESGYLRIFADSSDQPPYGKDLKSTFCLVGFNAESLLAVFNSEVAANPAEINAIRARFEYCD